jgi:hypothetical protein
VSSNNGSDAHRPAIGWGRAVLTGLVVIAVGAIASVGGANAVLTQATSLSRDVREYIATAVFLGVVILLAWALRRLQARGLI